MRIGAVVSHLRVLTTTALNQPSNLRRAPTETRRPRLRRAQRRTRTSCRGPSHAGAATPRTHPNHQRRQRLHRGAIDRQPANSALVAARAATATLTQRYGLRRGGRRYLHPRRRATPSLLRLPARRARTRPNAAAAGTPPTRARGRASRAGLPRRGHPTAPVVPQAYWRSGSSGRARSAKSRPG